MCYHNQAVSWTYFRKCKLGKVPFGYKTVFLTLFLRQRKDEVRGRLPHWQISAEARSNPGISKVTMTLMVRKNGILFWGWEIYLFYVCFESWRSLINLNVESHLFFWVRTTTNVSVICPSLTERIRETCHIPSKKKKKRGEGTGRWTNQPTRVVFPLGDIFTQVYFTAVFPYNATLFF